MSHVVEIKTEFRDARVLQRACEKKGITCDVAAPGGTLTCELYEGNVKGVAAFTPKGWEYPVVVQADGTCKADNYNGRWGRDSALDEIRQQYGVEVARDRMLGARFRETHEETLADGSVQLVFVG